MSLDAPRGAFLAMQHLLSLFQKSRAREQQMSFSGHNQPQKRIPEGKFSGLTLIELLIVVLIISILSGTAIFYINTDSYRLRAEANNLKSTLEEARAEAIKKNESVNVTVYKNKYETSFYNEEVYFDKIIVTYTGGEPPEKFGNDLERSVDLTSLGTTNGLHVILGTDHEYYSVCVNQAGKIWIIENDINDKKPCSS